MTGMCLKMGPAPVSRATSLFFKRSHSDSVCVCLCVCVFVCLCGSGQWGKTVGGRGFAPPRTSTPSPVAREGLRSFFFIFPRDPPPDTPDTSLREFDPNGVWSRRRPRTFCSSPELDACVRHRACRLARHVHPSHLPAHVLGGRAAHPLHLLPARQRQLAERRKSAPPSELN